MSAAVFSLDGLALTMSRIGMNDIYLLTFVLASVYFFLKKRDFTSAVMFGLAISSKWSAVWAIPVFGVLFLVIRKKFSPSLVWFFILPPLIYVLSYFQMFLTGHNFEIFIGMQKQMWWYHTNLRATHPYTSSWWSWPLDIRPVYLYTSEEVEGWVARIYNLGNPVVFWFGLFSVAVSLVYSFLEKNKKLAAVVFSYLVFFVPWAASPRIMFFYHYLPSLPFLAIASGYVLRRFPKIIAYFLVSGALLFIYFYPHWIGLKIPLWLDSSYYWFLGWR
jgi:dolichyl-phosphate-mannose--protein O-mannosyl transferase